MTVQGNARLMRVTVVVLWGGATLPLMVQVEGACGVQKEAVRIPESATARFLFGTAGVGGQRRSVDN